jgi:hypothetical protein
LVALGIAARLVRYWLAFPLFYDEYMVAENLLSRGFLGVLRPLDNFQVAPPLFMVLELAAVKIFGFSEWSLRLVPVISGGVALLLFMHVARRLLRGPSCALAVGIMASAYYPMRHSAEIKPYATDLFAAAVLLALAVEWLCKPNQSRWLWALTVTIPLAVALSFTTVFLGGGISVIIIGEVVRRRSRSITLAAVAYHLAFALGVVGLIAISASTQMHRWGPGMREYWADSFPPPLTQPLAFVNWIAMNASGAMFSYPVGGKAGASFATLACFVVGVAVLLRHRRHALVVLLATPFLLGFAAGALHLYPFGDNERLVQYLAPAICLTSGLGLAAIVARCPHSVRRPLFASLVIYFAALPCGGIIRDVTHPYKHRQDRDYQSFARWFWNENRGAVERRAIPVLQNSAIYRRTKYSAYACYQSIYGRDADPGDCEAGDGNGMPSAPREYVLYHTGDDTLDPQAFDAWLRQMESRYRLMGCTRYRIHSEVGPLHGPHDMHIYDVYRFNPNARAAVAQQSPETMLR